MLLRYENVKAGAPAIRSRGMAAVGFLAILTATVSMPVHTARGATIKKIAYYGVALANIPFGDYESIEAFEEGTIASIKRPYAAILDSTIDVNSGFTVDIELRGEPINVSTLSRAYWVFSVSEDVEYRIDSFFRMASGGGQLLVALRDLTARADPESWNVITALYRPESPILAPLVGTLSKGHEYRFDVMGLSELESTNAIGGASLTIVHEVPEPSGYLVVSAATVGLLTRFRNRRV